MRLLSFLATIGLFSAVVVLAAQKDDKSKDSKAKDEKAKKETTAPAASAALYPPPTDIHKELVKANEGVWDATMRFYAKGPDQPPQEFKGTETIRAAADGLFLITEFEADFVGGKKFRGHGITGYDTRKRKIVGTWADNMNTSIGTLTGDYDPKTKTVTYQFEITDPATGQMRKDKQVDEQKGEGHKLYTIYGSGPAGSQVKLMEIETVRRKDADTSKPGEQKEQAKKDVKDGK
jgi:Protein of unknown function (DUF1579)